MPSLIEEHIFIKTNPATLIEVGAWSGTIFIDSVPIGELKPGGWLWLEAQGYIVKRVQPKPPRGDRKTRRDHVRD
jgi:hypothetical protein